MNTITRRLRRLEDARAPLEQEQAMVEAILASRRRRLGASYEPPETFPSESYAGCRTIADRILRTRQLLMERQRARSDGLAP